MKNVFLLIFSTLFFQITIAQETTIYGEVYDEFLEPFSGAIVKSSEGVSTTSKFDGTFKIKIKLPNTLTVNYEGFSVEQVDIKDPKQKVTLILKRSKSFDRYVMSASRIPERIFESPSTIFKLDLDQIKKSSAFSFYEAIGDLNEVSIFSNGFATTTINTRGFSDLENARFVQLIDGVDNVHPTTGFAIGNLTGLVDSDVKRVEVLPGASSALYGANAFNGVMLIESKNPFEYHGITTEFKTGIIVQEDVDFESLEKKNTTTPFYNVNARAAYKFNDVFAGKISFGYLKSEDWHADDYRNTIGIGEEVLDQVGRQTTNYDGVNTYGDEYNVNLKSLPYLASLQNPTPENIAAIGLVPDEFISRTGYKESDLVNPEVNVIKFNSSLNFRPFSNDKLEIIWRYRYAATKMPFQSPPNRYSINGNNSLHSLEFKGNNFFLRGYYTKVDSDKRSFNTRLTGILLNQKFKSDNQWFAEAAGAYVNLKGQDNIHEKVRRFVDKGRFEPGTAAFNKAYNEIITTPIKDGGSQYVDNTSLVHAEGNYNFSHLIDFANIQVGGAFRRNILDSDGNLFTDKVNEKIFVDEYGFYTQIQKKFLDDRLKFTGAIRYDKSRNFEANISPRTSLVYTLGEDRNHSIRFSYQTAFKNPKLLDQYMGLKTNNKTYNVGNVIDNKDRFETEVEIFDPITKKNVLVPINGDFIYKYGFSQESFINLLQKLSSLVDDDADYLELSAAIQPSLDELETIKAQEGLVPEQNTTFEFGYRGMINISDKNMIELDVNSYFSKYTNLINFISSIIPLVGDANASKENLRNPKSFENGDPYTLAVFSTLTRNSVRFNLPVNSKSEIDTYGVSLSLKTQLFYKFDIGLNYFWSDYFYKDDFSDFDPGFNSPNHVVKFHLGSHNLYKNFGFNISTLWQSESEWSSEYAKTILDPRTVVNAHISFKVPAINSNFKIGGNNILGKEYYTAVGPGKVGSTYFISWSIND